MRYKQYIVALATLLSFNSCVDLNMSNPSSISSSDVWADPQLIQMYVKTKLEITIQNQIL